MLTPEEIQSREFLVSLRGYDRDEVHAFLDRVAEHVRELQARMEGQGSAPATAAPAAAPGQSGDMFAQIGQETRRILEAAQEAGEALKRTARQEADRDLQGARAEAARMIAEGERRLESTEELVRNLEAAKAQLAEDLRNVGRVIEGSLRDLLGEEPHASSVREALAAEALPDDAEPPAAETAPDAQPGEPGGQPTVDEGEQTTELYVEADDAAEPEDDEPGTHEPTEGLPEVPADGPLGARQAALSPLNIRLVRQIKRGLHDVQNVVLDRLRRADGRGELESFLPTDDELLDFTVGAAEVLQEAYEAGRSVAAQQLGRDVGEPERIPDLVDVFLDDAADRIRGGLAANLRMGFEVDEDLGALSARVSAVFGEIKQATAEEWAANHLVRSFELGQLDAWASAGVTHREWVVGPEPRCPEARCRSNGQSAVLPLDAAYPSGHAAPPVHPGCTCTTVPVLDPGAESLT